MALRDASAYAESIHFVEFRSHYPPPGVTGEGAAQRAALMKLVAKLMETEYHQHMDRVVSAWEAYKSSRG